MITNATAVLDAASDVKWGTVPDWLTAVGAVVLGIGVALLGAHQWRREGFLPKAQAWLDSEHAVVGIKVWNAGRGKGYIEKVLIVRERGKADPETWELTFPGVGADATWTRQPLDGSDAVVLYVKRINGEVFPSEHLTLKVWLGGNATITKTVGQGTHSYRGLTAQLPRAD